jgi:hypothetical protein
MLTKWAQVGAKTPVCKESLVIDVGSAPELLRAAGSENGASPNRFGGRSVQGLAVSDGYPRQSVSQSRMRSSPSARATTTGSLQTTARNRTLIRCSPDETGRRTVWPPRTFSTIEPSSSIENGWKRNQGHPDLLSMRMAVPVTTLRGYRDGPPTRRSGAGSVASSLCPRTTAGNSSAIAAVSRDKCRSSRLTVQLLPRTWSGFPSGRARSAAEPLGPPRNGTPTALKRDAHPAIGDAVAPRRTLLSLGEGADP